MFKKIKFDKANYSLSKDLRPWNNRRLAAAKRAVKKEIEKAGLFPELARFSSVEERVSQIDSSMRDRINFF
jgi:hypothetical protein